MAGPTRIIDDTHAPLALALQALQLSGTLYCQGVMTAPWGIDVPSLDDQVGLLIITAGTAHLATATDETRLLQPGSLTLLTRGQPMQLASAPGASLTALEDLPVEPVTRRFERVFHGGGGAETRFTFALMKIEDPTTRQLFRELPESIEVNGWDALVETWLRSTVQLISEEARLMRPGSETLITRLADILVIQLIRRWLEHAGPGERGWLAALHEPGLGRALAAIHTDPATNWSLDSLAGIAAMSRSAFCARFTTMLDTAPMKYVTRHRLARARDALVQTRDSLVDISERYGYGSDAAFSRAFKKYYGMAPGRVRAGRQPH